MAEFFGKLHKNVLRDIEIIIDRGRLNFEPSSYAVGNSPKRYKIYTMDRDGFALLAMGFTGEKAFEFKAQFLDAFNAMEKKLKEQVKFSIQMSRLELFEAELAAEKEQTAGK